MSKRKPEAKTWLTRAELASVLNVHPDQVSKQKTDGWYSAPGLTKEVNRRTLFHRRCIAVHATRTTKAPVTSEKTGLKREHLEGIIRRHHEYICRKKAVPIAAASTKIRAKLTGKIAAGGSR